MTFIEFVGAELARRWELENATAVAVPGGGVIPRMKSKMLLTLYGRHRLNGCWQIVS